MEGVRRDASSGAIVLEISGAVARADIPALCERLRALLATSDHVAGPVICDLGELSRANASTVAALARLQLTARRFGQRIQLRHASAELRALLALTGLAGVLPLEPELPLRPRWQAEEREQPRGIQEERDPADPAV